jgi:hypothetical protein
MNSDNQVDKLSSPIRQLIGIICWIILIALFVVGLSGPIFGPIAIYNTVSAYDWPSKRAVVQSIEKEINNADSGRSITSKVHGKYFESGETFVCKNIRYGDIPMNVDLIVDTYAENYQYLKRNYDHGQVITVFHEPGDPSTVILEQNDIFTPIVYMIISAVILLSPFWWPRLRDFFSSMEQ